MRFVEIPAPFAEQMQGFTIPPNQFNYTKTVDGRAVVHPNALQEFPEQFAELKATGWVPEVINLTAEDFPPPPEFILG